MHVLFSKSSHCLSYLLEYVSALKILRRVKLQIFPSKHIIPGSPSLNIIPNGVALLLGLDKVCGISRYGKASLSTTLSNTDSAWF